MFRANGALTNIDAFYKGLDVKPGDQNVRRSSEARISRIW